VIVGRRHGHHSSNRALAIGRGTWPGGALRRRAFFQRIFMYVCKLELWPENDAASAYSLGEIRIGQKSGDCFVADYTVEIDKASRQARAPGVWRTAEVAAFDHSQLGPYDLLLRALIATVGGRSHGAVARLTAACIFGPDINHQAA
jgi:hypothetical protein